MRKIILVLLLTFFGIKSYAQGGDLHLGAQGGYVNFDEYGGFLYGLNLSYDFSNLLQISATGLMNPNVIKKDGFDSTRDEKISLYSTNLDVRFFMINQEVWAMGPSFGGQYLSAKYSYRYTPSPDATDYYDLSLRDYDTTGFNIGWHIRANITDNLRATAGWRYTSAGEGANHHFFYLGVGYAINLF